MAILLPGADKAVEEGKGEEKTASAERFLARKKENACVSAENLVQGLFDSSVVQTLSANDGEVLRDGKKNSRQGLSFPPICGRLSEQKERHSFCFFCYVCESASQRRQFPHSPNMSKEDAHG